MKYTKEQIDSMTPEQLKRTVATDVMGLSIYHYDKDYEANCYYMLVDGLDPVARFDGMTSGERKTEELAWADCPDYLNDLLAAWEVVDKLKIAIIPQSDGAPNDLKYLARIEKDFEQDEIQAFASTAPEAVCKVALLAIKEVKAVNDESPIEEIDNLSVRTYACLKRAGIDTAGQVKKLSLQQVTTIKNIGRKSVEELEDKLNIKFM